MEDGVEKFFQRIAPLLEREKKFIIVPMSVCKELEKLANDPVYCKKKYPNNPNLNKKAISTGKMIQRLYASKFIEIFGDPDDGDFADNVFWHVLVKKRMQYNMLLITQDRKLASDALRLGKDSGSVKGVKKIIVQCINKNGFLNQIFENVDKTPTTSSENFSSEIPPNERFAIAKEITKIEGKIHVSHIPKTGEYVTAVKGNKNRTLRLIENIGSGGEGSVYKTDVDGIVAKVYNAEKITCERYEKLKLMLTKDINCAGVCFPLGLVYNQKNEFVGYIMKAASGMELGRSFFLPPLRLKYFPNWTKAETVQLCVTILKKLKYLHDRNIILGDINPYNILVKSPTEVYFVDTDSWQVEGFICPVGMPLFTAPELQSKKEFSLRNIGNENFAVATLLFMIMHPGKPPYAMQDGGGIVENILKGDFSYPLGEKKNGKVPKGPWRYCWSHLPYKVKEAFYQTFRYDGEYHDKAKRLSTGYWLKIFEWYLELIKSGKMTAQDEESVLLFPTRFKKDINKNYVKCKICKKEYDEERLQEGICHDCLKDGEKYHCERCGRELIYTNYQKYIKHSRRYEICRECFEKKNTIYERRICKNCGQAFDITNGEKEFFVNRSMPLPTRCKNCRGEQNKTQTSNVISNIFKKFFH